MKYSIVDAVGLGVDSEHLLCDPIHGPHPPPPLVLRFSVSLSHGINKIATTPSHSLTLFPSNPSTFSLILFNSTPSTHDLIAVDTTRWSQRMQVLEDSSPLDALAFNYQLSFGFLTFLNNLWTWLAFSFWKIPSPEPELLPPPSDKPDPVPDVSEPDDADSVLLPAVVIRNGAADDVDGVTKGKLKFALYYEDDIDRSDGALTGEWEWEEREGIRGEWWEGWERLLRMRRGESENGWYTCQDLTALNGNVVRLWDGMAGTVRD